MPICTLKEFPHTHTHRSWSYKFPHELKYSSTTLATSSRNANVNYPGCHCLVGETQKQGTALLPYKCQKEKYCGLLLIFTIIKEVARLDVSMNDVEGVNST